MKKNLLLRITAIIALFIFGLSSLYYFVYRPYAKDKLREKCAQTIISQNGGASSDDIQEGINFCVNTNFLNWKKQGACGFEIIDLKENRYQEDKEKSVGEFLGRKYNFPARNYTYWEIKGLLKNNSKKEQTLKSMVLKIYSNDDNNTLLAEGYSDINKTISTDQSMPFLIKAQIDRNGNLAEYFKKDDKVRIDVYPYFTTCN